MDLFFYWTGVAVWVGVAGLALRLAYELGIALCVAVDWLAWQLAMCREHKAKVKWLRLPALFLKCWWRFATDGHGNTTWSSSNGYWNGFRKWGVYPAGKA